MFKGRSTQKGLNATTAILSKLVSLGYECLVPWGDDRRYDLAFIKTRMGFFKQVAEVYRVQCKHARLSEDGSYLTFNTGSTTPGTRNLKGVKRGYEGEAEYFGVYSPDTGKVYLI